MLLTLVKWISYVALLSGFSFAGDSVRNGDGLAEENIYRAFYELKFIYQECLNSTSCLPDKDSQRFLSKLVRDFSLEEKTPDPIRFFTEDTQLRFRTFPKVGEVIYVNRNHLYRPSREGTVVPMGISGAAGLLTEALLLHQGLLDEAQRNYIAKTIENRAEIFIHSRRSIFSN